MQEVLLEQKVSEFLSRHQLPEIFRQTAGQFYLPLARQLPIIRQRLKVSEGPLLLGVNGAQGTGKSTLADYLQLACASMFGWNVAVLSIDDFYYTQEQRVALAKDVHPLLSIRGVPGTHDTAMLAGCLENLQHLQRGDKTPLPRFNKAIDDRECDSQWPFIEGPIDLVILEGWCVGSKSETEHSLQEPINELERVHDSDGAWRGYVNEQLNKHYSTIFNRLNILVFLKAPSFDAVHRWRLEQEQKLANKPGVDSAKLMNKDDILRFIQFYERLTKANLATLPDEANLIFDLDESHRVVSEFSNGYFESLK